MKKIFLITFPILFLVSCNNFLGTVVGEYDVSKLSGDFVHQEQYEIGANMEGMPIFKDTKKALELAKVDYKEGFEAIEKEFELDPINNQNYKDYKQIAWQLTTKDENINQQGVEISKFLDIYENSFE